MLMRDDYIGKVYIPGIGWQEIGRPSEELRPPFEDALMEQVRGLPAGRKLIALWAITYLEPESRVALMASEEIENLLGEDMYASFFQLTGFLMLAGVPKPANVAGLLKQVLG